MKSIVIALFLFVGKHVALAKKIDNKTRAKDATESGIAPFAIGCDKLSNEDITEEEGNMITELGAKLFDVKYAEVTGQPRRQLRGEDRNLQTTSFCCLNQPLMCWICCRNCYNTNRRASVVEMDNIEIDENDRKLQGGDVILESETDSMKKMLNKAGVKLDNDEKKFAKQFECSLFWTST